MALIRKVQPLCEICNDVESKYVCPRCKLHTCSLACFKTHKTEKNCSGMSDTSAGTRDTYIKKKELAQDDVQRDYNFLLKVNRSLDLSKRSKTEMKILKPTSNNNNTRFKNRGNGQEQIIQGVRVRKMPFGMERGKMNKSGRKQKSWFWTLEWIMVDSSMTSVEKYLRFRALETQTLKELIPKGWIGEGELFTILLRDIEENVYIKLSPEMKLNDALRGKLVIEFPTLLLKKGDTEFSKGFKIVDAESESGNSSSDSDTSSSDSESESESESSSDSDSDSGSNPSSEGKLEDQGPTASRSIKGSERSGILKEDYNSDSDSAPEEMSSKDPSTVI